MADLTTGVNFMPSLPQVLKYHFRVGVVDNDGRMKVIHMELPDFEMQDEILNNIKSELGVKTAGDMVQAMQCKNNKAKLEKFGYTDCIVDGDACGTINVLNFDDKLDY